MKTKTKDLLAALEPSLSIATGRTTLPILSCIRLEAKDGKLSMRLTDLDESATELVECDGDLEAVCVPASHFNYLASSCHKTVSLKVVKNRLVFNGEWNAEIAKHSAEEWPAVPQGDLVQQGVPVTDLADAIDAVKWAASKDATRYVMVSVFVKCEPKKVVAEATSGFSLSHFERALISATCNFILPVDSAARFAATLRKDNAKLFLSDKHAVVRHDWGEFSTKLVDGKFPNTKEMLNQKRTPLGELSAEAVAAFIDALTVCNKLCPPAKCTAVALDFTAKGIDLAFKSADNAYERTIAGEFQPHKTRINALTFIDCLKAFGEQAVKLSLSESNDAMVMQAGDLSAMTIPLRS